MYKITIEQKALKELSYFQKRDKTILQRIRELLVDIEKHPFEGIGKPEPLKFELTGKWSRRVNREHRLVYKVTGNEVTVFSFRYHY